MSLYWITKLISGGNLTVLTINGAGHMVPISKPAVARQMLKDFIKSDKDFNGDIKKPPFDHAITTC